VKCCYTLWKAGFGAWPVGGCVRDLLLDRVPGDFDVTTSARPEQVMELFDHTVPTGVKHGTVTVILEGETLEVTTLRGETGYSDGRHPDGVVFGVSLEEDLARRDFTVNAMAIRPDGSVADPFHGWKDLRAGCIRCVGEPRRRFEEDALRMLRGVRFGAQLDFEIEKNTLKAMEACACKVENLAAERVLVEVEKTLLSPRPERLGQMFELGLLAPWYDGPVPKLAGLGGVACERLARWAALCRRLGDGQFPARLRSDKALARACREGLELYRSGVPTQARGWRHALARYGADSCRAAAAMTGKPEAAEELERVLAQNPCVRVTDLALSGGELKKLGYTGADIGRVQRELLELVLDEPERNTTRKLWAALCRDKAVQG
jgi:tRNA nucleotidyltransferase (CCA-adding enzyme)